MKDQEKISSQNQEFKIVCFVRNDASHSGAGLRNAFNEERNDFIKKFLYEGASKFCDFGKGESNKFILITAKGAEAKETISNKDDWEILLVSDDEAPGQEMFKPNSLVMDHENNPCTKDKLTYDYSLSNIHKVKIGQHINDASQGYARLYILTEAWKIGRASCRERV